jgi:hypothetical protein
LDFAPEAALDALGAPDALDADGELSAALGAEARDDALDAADAHSKHSNSSVLPIL